MLCSVFSSVISVWLLQLFDHLLVARQVPTMYKAIIILTKMMLEVIYVFVCVGLVTKASLSSHWYPRCSKADCSLCGKDNWDSGGALL